MANHIYQLTPLECPNGRWTLVGSVPVQLAFETDDPSLIEVAARCGLGLAQKIAANRGKFIHTLTWATREECVAAVKEAANG